jgi:hypothetical protein
MQLGEVMAAGKDVAVVSHQSAIVLWHLSGVVPDVVHLTIPWAHGGQQLEAKTEREGVQFRNKPDQPRTGGRRGWTASARSSRSSLRTTCSRQGCRESHRVEVGRVATKKDSERPARRGGFWNAPETSLWRARVRV